MTASAATADCAPRQDSQAGSPSVLIAEDDPRLRRALARIIERQTEFVLVGEASDGEQAVQLSVELSPSIVLMDVRMPRLTGIEATRRLSRLAPNTKVIALSAYPTASYVLPMIRAGASGYLTKDFVQAELFSAMRTVLGDDDHFAIAPELVRMLATCAVDGPFRPADIVMPTGSVELTPRETELVTWLARGFNNRGIAEGMCVSEASVKTYMNHIMTKLAVHDRVQVLIRCYELGIVNPALPRSGSPSSASEQSPGSSPAEESRRRPTPTPGGRS